MKLEGIRQKLRDGATKAVRETAKQIQRDAEAEFNRDVLAFYDDYEPKKYERGGNLRHAIQTHIVNIKGAKSTVQVAFTAEDMGDPYRDSAEYVRHGAIDLGIHGTSDIAVMEESPRKKFEKWSDDYMATDIKPLLERHIKSALKSIK